MTAVAAPMLVPEPDGPVLVLDSHAAGGVIQLTTYLAALGASTSTGRLIGLHSFPLEDAQAWRAMVCALLEAGPHAGFGRVHSVGAGAVEAYLETQGAQR